MLLLYCIVQSIWHGTNFHHTIPSLIITAAAAAATTTATTTTATTTTTTGFFSDNTLKFFFVNLLTFPSLCQIPTLPDFLDKWRHRRQGSLNIHTKDVVTDLFSENGLKQRCDEELRSDGVGIGVDVDDALPRQSSEHRSTIAEMRLCERSSRRSEVG